MKRTRIICGSDRRRGSRFLCGLVLQRAEERTRWRWIGAKYAGLLASTLDAGVVGPNGEVILFYKSGGNIVIQQCGDYTVLNSRSDCKTKARNFSCECSCGRIQKSFENGAQAADRRLFVGYAEKIAVYRKGETSKHR